VFESFLEIEILVSLASVILVLHLHFDISGSTVARGLTKAALSGLFLLVAYNESSKSRVLIDQYDRLMAGGLVCGFFGDILLLGTSKIMFLSGLTVFLIGHIFYIASFAYLLNIYGFPTWNLGVLLECLILLIFVVIIYSFYLSPHLQNMKIPVFCYVIVISLMMFFAILILNNHVMDGKPKTLVFIGALLFFISDLFVARQQFIIKSPWNRIVGLPTYYAGQFLLAYSSGVIDLA